MNRLSWLRLIFILLLVLLTWVCRAQLQATSFQDLEELRLNAPKHTVIFIHTNWCKYCLQMEHTTFADSSVVERLNQDFYFTKLDAEQRKPIQFLGHSFEFNPTGSNTGQHALAAELGTVDGKLNFPTICILNTQNEIVFQHAGYMDQEELSAVLNELTK